MTTTIGPVANSGPDDDLYGPTFPASTGTVTSTSLLKESKQGAYLKSAAPKKEAKTFIKAAEGVKTVGKKPKVKKGKKPENLKASEAKNQKKGAFGEKYKAAAGSTGKGVRVAESAAGRFHRQIESLR
jgi:hypothetical protein